MSRNRAALLLVIVLVCATAVFLVSRPHDPDGAAAPGGQSAAKRVDQAPTPERSAVRTPPEQTSSQPAPHPQEARQSAEDVEVTAGGQPGLPLPRPAEQGEPTIEPLDIEEPVSLHIQPDGELEAGYRLLAQCTSASGDEYAWFGRAEFALRPTDRDSVYRREYRVDWMRGSRDDHALDPGALPPTESEASTVDSTGEPLASQTRQRQSETPSEGEQESDRPPVRPVGFETLTPTLRPVHRPPGEVGTGDKWTWTAPPHRGETDQPDEVYEITGFAMVDGVKTLKVKRTAGWQSRGVEMKREELIYISLEDGMVEYAQGSYSVEAKGTTTARLRMQRQR